MTQAYHICTYTSARRLISLICLMVLTLAATAQKRTLPEPKDTLPTFRGVQVMGDVVGLIMLGVSDYGQYEGGVRVNLKDKYFPVIELGLGKADHHNDITQTDYQTSAPYGKVGIDFNVLKNKHDDYKVYVGVRYAFTSFKFDIAHPDVSDPVWGGTVPYGGQDVKGKYHWAEAVFGVDAKIFGPLHLGWSVRYKRRLSHDIAEMGNCWYVPGYGKAGSTRLGGTFNIMLNF